VRTRCILALVALLPGCANARNDSVVQAPALAEAGAEPVSESDAAAGEPPPVVRERVRLGAANFQVSVLDRMEWPETGNGAKRLGYLRHGAVVDAWSPPTPNDECKDGWYELVSGGFVCGKAAVVDLTSPRVRLAPKQPDRASGMPYRYGLNVADGTPLYRRVLSADDRKKYEAPPARAKSTSDEPSPSADSESKSVEPGPDREEVAEGEGAPPAIKRVATTTADGNETKPERPRLKDLKGRGVLVRKLARGFFVALDRDFKAANARWWRTTFGFATPFDRIMPQPPRTKYANARFPAATFPALDPDAHDGGAPALPLVGFFSHGSAHKIELREDRKVVWGPELAKRSSVLLTGRTESIGGVTHYEAAGGFYVRLSDVKLARPQPPPDLGPNEKWIDVDLTRQMLVAFEGTTPVFATLVSSGRRNLVDKEHDFPTPTGMFRIREKHVTTTMDGDVAADGAYSIEDVPWVMYFQGSYALHGAFWHDSFGNPRSHGCVNLSPEDAHTLFEWVDPPLPDAWHGAFSGDESSGTRVIVHEDPSPRRRLSAR
jgi:hypothetical protein